VFEHSRNPFHRPSHWGGGLLSFYEKSGGFSILVICLQPPKDELPSQAFKLSVFECFEKKAPLKVKELGRKGKFGRIVVGKGSGNDLHGMALMRGTLDKDLHLVRDHQ